ncbi:uncharacterized protein LOC144157718 [Haemaphysalis longicornis]
MFAEDRSPNGGSSSAQRLTSGPWNRHPKRVGFGDSADEEEPAVPWGPSPATATAAAVDAGAAATRGSPPAPVTPSPPLQEGSSENPRRPKNSASCGGGERRPAQPASAKQVTCRTCNQGRPQHVAQRERRPTPAATIPWATDPRAANAPEPPTPVHRRR